MWEDQSNAGNVQHKDGNGRKLQRTWQKRTWLHIHQLFSLHVNTGTNIRPPEPVMLLIFSLGPSVIRHAPDPAAVQAQERLRIGEMFVFWLKPLFV